MFDYSDLNCYDYVFLSLLHPIYKKVNLYGLFSILPVLLDCFLGLFQIKTNVEFLASFHEHLGSVVDTYVEYQLE